MFNPKFSRFSQRVPELLLKVPQHGTEFSDVLCSQPKDLGSFIQGRALGFARSEIVLGAH